MLAFVVFFSLPVLGPGLARSTLDNEKTASSNNEQYCSQKSLVACAYPTAVKEITFATKKEDLDTLCPHLHVGLRCIDNYTKLCLAPEQRSHFNKLYAGTSMVIHEICASGHYQEEFLRHAPCMNRLTSEYEQCVQRYQQQLKNLTINNEPTEGLKKICGNLNEYIQCSKRIVLRTCGEETATFAAGFLDKMSSSLLHSHCVKEEEEIHANSVARSTTSLYSLLTAAVLMYFTL